MEIDSSRLYLKLDMNSTFAYCQRYLGLSDAVIYNFITVARKSREIPALRLAIEEQALTVATARKIAPVLNHDNQIDWIEKAKNLPQKVLEREIVEQSPPVAKMQERVTPKQNGLVEVKLYLNKEEYEEFLRVQDLVSQSQQKSVGMSEAFVAANKCYLHYKDPIQKTARKRNSSQTSLMAVIHAVNERDLRHCQALNSAGIKCNNTRFIHYHHKIQVCDGGPTTAANLITLCSSCHRRWHDRK